MNNFHYRCFNCGKLDLSKDEIGACKKLINPDMSNFLCMECLAIDLECEIDFLRDKIQEFKDSGCELFN